jgi:hypothetical protein
MRTPPRLPFRHRGRLVAVLAAAALLAGCGGGAADEASSSTPPSSSPASAEPDLASGLLTAEAFGPDAAVQSVSPEQLEQGAGLAAGLEDLQVTPEECLAAVEKTSPKFEEFGDVAAVSATAGSLATVEVLVRGGPTQDAVTQMTESAQRCPQAQITAPEFGSAAIAFESLPVDDLGDAAGLLRYTTTVSLPDGTQATIPALVGAVEDGDRLLILTSLDTAGTGPAPDPTAFAALLREAYETQAAALD